MATAKKILCVGVLGLVLNGEAALAGSPQATNTQQDRPSLESQVRETLDGRQIRLDANGPKSDAFKSYDLPFLAAWWLCVDPEVVKNANDDLNGLQQIEAELRKVHTDRARRRSCEKALSKGELMDEAASSGDVDRRPTAGQEAREQRLVLYNEDKGTRLQVRILAPADPKACKDAITKSVQGNKTKFSADTRVVDLAPGASEYIGLDTLSSCLTDGRANFLVSKWVSENPPTSAAKSTDHSEGGSQDNSQFTGNEELRPVSGFAISFNLPRQLETPRIAQYTVSQGSDTSCSRTYAVNVDLDATGIASIRFRNPRWPPYLGPNATLDPKELTEIEFQRCADIVFSNRLVDRRFVVTFTGIKPAMRWALLEVPGMSTRCEGETCSASLLVGPGVTGSGVRIIALRRTYIDAPTPQREPVTFTVAFFEDDREPTYARGYFSLVQFHQMAERKSGTQWSAAVSADVAAIPDLVELDPKIQPSLTAPPSVRANDSRAQGAVRVSLRQQVGARASGEFELRLRSGELGGSEPNIAATKYRLDVNLLNGLILTGGRFVVAAPGETIAISEVGDNLGFRYGPFAANYILRKQVRNALPDILDPNATETDRDHSTGVLQLNGIPLGSYRSISFDLVGLIGERSLSRSIAETPSSPAARVDRKYWTVGGEVNWLAVRDWRWSSSFYRSRVRSQFAENARQLASDHGRGWVTLHTLTYTNYDGDASDLRQSVDWTVQGRAGLGSKDDPGTTMERESYAGEGNPFAPDVLFLSAIAPALENNRVLTKGLAGKSYAGLSVTRPIRGIAELLRLPQGEISAVSASLRVHRYWQRGTLQSDSVLATELNASISAEIPRGVKALLSVAYLRPGTALSNLSVVHPTGSRPVLDRNIWSLIAGMSVTLQ